MQKCFGRDIADIMNYCEGPGKKEFSEDFQYIIDNTPNFNRLIQEITTEVNIKEIAVPIWKQIKNKKRVLGGKRRSYVVGSTGQLCYIHRMVYILRNRSERFRKNIIRRLPQSIT